MPDDLIARLRGYCEKRTAKGGCADCWAWTGASDTKKRGNVSIIGFRSTAPRAALIMAQGQPPFVGAEACHSCDNPNCVNPAHLWWGSHQENMQDASKKRRLTNKNTHCKRGHELTSGNVTITMSASHGRGRRCKTCDNQQRRDKRKAARCTS